MILYGQNMILVAMETGRSWSSIWPRLAVSSIVALEGANASNDSTGSTDSTDCTDWFFRTGCSCSLAFLACDRNAHFVDKLYEVGHTRALRVDY